MINDTNHDLAHAVGCVLRLGQSGALRRADILRFVRELPQYKDISDDQIRSAIGELRERGELAVNLTNGEGYFYADTAQEYQDFRRLYVSYATTILARIKEMDKAAADLWGGGVLLQEKLF